MRADLICHPSHPAKAVQGISIEIEPAPHGWTIWYEVEAETSNILIPAERPSRRMDGLWETTCFEAFFIRPGDNCYLEFNISTSSDWAAYVFDGYRAGRQDFEIAHPPIVSRIEQAFALDVHVTLPIAPGPWRAALNAIIEEADGTKSWWALAHPPGDPDFHHPDCFALELPAPDGA